MFHPPLFRGPELQLRLERKLSNALLTICGVMRNGGLSASWVSCHLQAATAWRKSPRNPMCEAITVWFLTSFRIGASECWVQMPRSPRHLSHTEPSAEEATCHPAGWAPSRLSALREEENTLRDAKGFLYSWTPWWCVTAAGSTFTQSHGPSAQLRGKSEYKVCWDLA